LSSALHELPNHFHNPDPAKTRYLKVGKIAISFQLQKRKKNSRFSKSTIDGKLLS
jgi:hypothetical protein